MDLDLLKVYNTMYGFGLVDQDYLDIAAEQKSDHTGVFVLKPVKDSYLCVCNDDTMRGVPKLFIHKITSPIPIPPKSRILFKTLITFEVPEEVYTLHTIAHFRAMDSSIADVANTMDKLKEIICNRFADKYPKDLGISDATEGDALLKREDVANTQLNALCWLFGDKPMDISQIPTRTNIARIIKVWEHKNKRVCVILEQENYDREDGSWSHRHTQVVRSTLAVITYKPSDPQYNYADINRELLKSYNDGYGNAWVADNMFEKISYEELKAIAQGEPSWMLVDSDMLLAAQEKLRNIKLNEQRSAATQKFIEQVESQFEKGSVTRFGITFTPKWFGIGPAKIYGPLLIEYFGQHHILTLETPNFENIVSGYLDYVTGIINRRAGDRFEYEMKLNKVKLKICAHITRDSCSKQLIDVNSRKIWISDLGNIFRIGLICTQKEFEQYVEQTSRIPLKVQAMIKAGYVKFEMRDVVRDCDCADVSEETNCYSSSDKKVVIVLPLKIAEGRAVVYVKKKPIFVKNIKSLLLLTDDPRSWDPIELSQRIKQMQRAFSKITEEEIAYLITRGRVEYQKVLKKERALKRLETKRDKSKEKKSLEFIKHAARLSKATRTKTGWIVKGKSGMFYYVGDNLQVYTLDKNGKQDEYLCIVDRDTNTSTKWGRNDAVAKRLLSLSKDLQIVDDVHTVKNMLIEKGLFYGLKGEEVEE